MSVSHREWTGRETDVLAVLRAPLNARTKVTPAVLARLLNLTAPCGWCPVGPPKAGERCASVPESSRRAAATALDRLFWSGLVAVVLVRRNGRAVRTCFDPWRG